MVSIENIYFWPKTLILKFHNRTDINVDKLNTCHVFKIPVRKRRKYISEFFTNGFENSDKKADDFAS